MFYSWLCKKQTSISHCWVSSLMDFFHWCSLTCRNFISIQGCSFKKEKWLFNYLFEVRVTERKREGKEVYCWLTPQSAAIAGADSAESRSHELHQVCHMGGRRQVTGASSAAFPGSSMGSLTGSREARDHTWHCSQVDA